MDGRAAVARGPALLGGFIPAEGVRQGDVRRHAPFEERADAALGLVVELVGDDDVPRMQRLLHAAHGADGDDALDAQLLERVDVRAVIDLAWRESMSTAVASQKGD